MVIKLTFTPNDEALGYLKPDDKECIPNKHIRNFLAIDMRVESLRQRA